VLYDRFFLPSLDQESFELFAIDLEQEGKGEFLADDFKRCILFKIEQIIASIKRHQGKIILWSDVDIQFFGLTAERLLQPFADNELQFAIQRLLAVGDEGCGGFYALRCNEQMLAFLSWCCTRLFMRLGVMSRMLSMFCCADRWHPSGHFLVPNIMRARMAYGFLVTPLFTMPHALLLVMPLNRRLSFWRI
jgi:hypothetical protein